MEPLDFSKTLTNTDFFYKCIVFALILSNYSCYKIERNCSNFRFGTFKYERIVGDKLSTSFFIRNNDIEIEYFNNRIDTSSISWVNECEFVLKKQNPGTNLEKKPISIKIISTHEDYYIFEFSHVGDDSNRQRGKIVKMSENMSLPSKF